MGFLWFYLYFSFKAEQCSEGHFRWEKVAMVLTGNPRLGAYSSVLSSVYVCMYQCIYPALFTQSPPVPPSEQRQTRKVTTKMASRFAVTKKFHKINNQTSCSRNTRRRWRNSVQKFSQEKLCLFDLNLSMKPVKKIFVFDEESKTYWWPLWETDKADIPSLEGL